MHSASQHNGAGTNCHSSGMIPDIFGLVSRGWFPAFVLHLILDVLPLVFIFLAFIFLGTGSGGLQLLFMELDM